MDKVKLLQAIKGGLKGELDSISLYQQAADKASGEVKTFLLERVQEEKNHCNYLLRYWDGSWDCDKLNRYL